MTLHYFLRLTDDSTYIAPKADRAVIVEQDYVQERICCALGSIAKCATKRNWQRPQTVQRHKMRVTAVYAINCLSRVELNHTRFPSTWSKDPVTFSASRAHQPDRLQWPTHQLCRGVHLTM